MTIKNALAGVAVAELDKAVAWYSKVLGHGPDSQPMPGLAEFSFERGGWLQLFEDEDRAGKSSVTLAVSDLKQQMLDLAEAGINVGDSSQTEYVATAIVKDPDGNQIVLAQALAQENKAAH